MALSPVGNRLGIFSCRILSLYSTSFRDGSKKAICKDRRIQIVFAINTTTYLFYFNQFLAYMVSNFRLRVKKDGFRYTTEQH